MIVAMVMTATAFLSPLRMIAHQSQGQRSLHEPLQTFRLKTLRPRNCLAVMVMLPHGKRSMEEDEDSKDGEVAGQGEAFEGEGKAVLEAHMAQTVLLVVSDLFSGALFPYQRLLVAGSKLAGEHGVGAIAIAMTRVSARGRLLIQAWTTILAFVA